VTGPSTCPTCGQPWQSSERQVREAIRSALDASGMTQVEFAARVGISEKHMSQVLTGKAGLPLDLADRLLNALGRRMKVGVTEAEADSDA